jgi:hypothetical protein
MPTTISFHYSGALGIGLLILLGVCGCGGDGDDDNNRLPQNPEADLVWDQGNWDELDWQ